MIQCPGKETEGNGVGPDTQRKAPLPSGQHIQRIIWLLVIEVVRQTGKSWPLNIPQFIFPFFCDTTLAPQSSSHMGAVQVPIAPLWIKFPAHVPGKAVKDGPNAHMGEQTEAAVTIWGVKQQTQDPCFPLVPPASVYICNSLFQTHTHTHTLPQKLFERNCIMVFHNKGSSVPNFWVIPAAFPWALAES